MAGTLVGGSASMLLVLGACQEKPPHSDVPLGPSSAAGVATAEPTPLHPHAEQPRDAGTLALEDAEAVTPPPRGTDAGALPAILPPLQGLKETCVQAMGRPVFFTQNVAPGGDFQGSNGYRVYEDEAAFRTLLGLGRLGTVDPQRQRLVRIKISQRPSANVTTVVDRGDAVVIIVDAPVYCGGAAPYSPVIDVVLPRSNKPIEVQSCSHGSCRGLPLP